MVDKSYSFKKNMIFLHESEILQICQKFHLASKIYYKPSVTVLTLIKGMSVIFQQGLKHVLLKTCDFIASSLEAVGSGSNFNEPVYCGLNEPLAGLVRCYCKHL